MESINALSILDKLDELRRKHNGDAAYQHAMRIACATIAREAGYQDRNEWTDALKADSSTAYARDCASPFIPF